MLTINEIKKQIELIKEMLVWAIEQDDVKRIYELNTALRCLKDALIDAYEAELKAA